MMSQSSDALFDHITYYLRFISNAQSFWLTLNTSYHHGCHLVNRFQMSAREYGSILAAANLAAYRFQSG